MVTLKNKVAFRYSAQPLEGMCYWYSLANIANDGSFLNIAPERKKDGYLGYEVNDFLKSKNIALYDIFAGGHPSDGLWRTKLKSWKAMPHESGLVIPLVVCIRQGRHAIGVILDVDNEEVYVMDSCHEYVQWFTFSEFCRCHIMSRVAVILDRATRTMQVSNLRDYGFDKTKYFV